MPQPLPNQTINQPKLTIITVVFNSVSFIERTIQNVLSQDYPAIEYIVIDGGSTDGTLDIIKKYNHKISCWISEPDKGLYDAMNKGMARATGDFLWFINSGDLLYASDTVSHIFAGHKPEHKVYYGETVIIDNDENEIGGRRLQCPAQLTWKSFAHGMLVSHQSIVVNRNIAPLYDLQYRYAADFDWVIKVLRKAAPDVRLSDKAIVNTNLVLSKFLDGGQTKRTIVRGLRERFKIMARNYGFVPTLTRHFIIGVKFLFFVVRHGRF